MRKLLRDTVLNGEGGAPQRSGRGSVEAKRDCEAAPARVAGRNGRAGNDHVVQRCRDGETERWERPKVRCGQTRKATAGLGSRHRALIRRELSLSEERCPHC
jgi:hypothetical protein